MRAIGYSLSTALADLVDNCIVAGATNIQIFSTPDTADLKVGILDDGAGMTDDELLEAMRLGTRSPLEERAQSDLGRFGLGLKTASFSQCRVLTVVTRVKGTTAVARWNLDHIAESGKWQVQIPDNLTSIPWVDLLGSSGTLVVWEQIDLGPDDVDSSKNSDDFVRQLDEARSHLELVFHRFLSGEPGRRKTKIEMNRRSLEPYDPFHSSHPATIAGPEERIQVANEHVLVQAFTLPHYGKVTAAQWERYARPDGYIRSQGFYLYRERRLIIYGTWFGLARQSELTKLARVRIDMPNALDGAWKIDVKKASAQLPPPVRARLRRIIDPLAATSKNVFQTKGKKLIEDNRIPVWTRLQNKNRISYRINSEHPMVLQFLSRLPPSHKDDFLKVLEVAGASLPMDALFADLGGDVDSSVNSETSDQALRYAAITTFAYLREIAGSVEDALTMMRVAEPFNTDWERTKQFIRGDS